MADRQRGLSDLHRHLDGSLRPATLRDLADGAGVAVPEPFGFFRGMGLQAALDCFRTTLAVLQSPEAVRRVAAELCEDAAGEGVTTLEVRFAPQLHGGASLGAIVDAALDGIAGRAGLVLCGLYGEPPDLLGQLVRVAESRPGVVGLDLAGAPAPGHRYRLADYADVFKMAGRVGLGRTVHAGEGRPPAEIAVAVERLGAERIGHGCTVLHDPEVTALVVARRVTIEVNLTSNVHVGAIAGPQDHPLPAWIDAGLRACVCTDNTLMSHTTAANEWALVRALPGMDEPKLAFVQQCGHAAAFRRAVGPAAP
ncbi:MAG: adenosine deaminase family protein [Deltaproteobacteria bacterium]|nr:adenosine deaminase family protein [Deltaproteobacteria bacterium]